MAESMLAILCHILRGEPVIRERLSKEKEGSRGEEDTGQEEGGSRREPQVNQQQLQQVRVLISDSRPYDLHLRESNAHKFFCVLLITTSNLYARLTLNLESCLDLPHAEIKVSCHLSCLHIF